MFDALAIVHGEIMMVVLLFLVFNCEDCDNVLNQDSGSLSEDELISFVLI